MDYIEGYEMIPEWRIEELEFEEYENWLKEIGYYKNWRYDNE